jgi:uncharacterized protein
MRKCRVPGVVLGMTAVVVGLTAFVSFAWSPVEPTPNFCAGWGPDHVTLDVGRQKLASFASQYSDLAGWEKRAAILREGIRKRMGLYPWPQKTPLNAVIHSKRSYPPYGYSVENVFFESFPGFFVTGNLYRPLNATGALPGILRAHGHGYASRLQNDDSQIHSAAMAHMGAVVFTYDMVGYGECVQITHCFPQGVVALQTWNTIRAVDFLLSLGCDSNRIAMTGCSGGGTQTYVASALDPRIKLAIPVTIVSATWYGGCNCEGTGMGIDHYPYANEKDTLYIPHYETDAAEIAALTAPRLQLLVTDPKDFAGPDMITVGFPYIQNVYKLYGAQNNATDFNCTATSCGGHNYNATKRVAVNQFLVDHFGMGPAIPDEALHKNLPYDSLRCITSAHPLPGYAIKALDGATILKRFYDHPTAVAPRKTIRSSAPVYWTIEKLRVTVTAAGPHTVRLVSLCGKLVYTAAGEGKKSYVLPALGKGVFVVSVASSYGEQERVVQY